MNLFDLVREIPGNAPKAGQFNRLAKNMEDLLAATTFRGAMIRKSADQTITNVQILAAVTFASSVYDTSSIWSAGSPNQLTVPSGVTRVRLQCNISLSVALAGVTFSIVQTTAAPTNTLTYKNEGSSIRALNIITPILSVASGDSFTVLLNFTGGTASSVVNNESTWFAMEIIK